MEGAPAGTSMIKHLASCNKTTRDKALKLLKTWLPSQSQVSDDDMKKLWKGLFYCIWHADKAPVQSDLINRLSSLLLTLDLPLSVHYFSVFLLTMRREWTGIDGLRLDKFYLFIRRFLHSFFLLLKRNSWDSELSHRLMTVLEEKAFFADDKFLGNGVNYHIASVFLEELKPFLPVRSETLDVIFKPFLSVMVKSQDKVLVGKIKANIFDVFLKMGKSLLECKKLENSVDDSGDEMVLFGTIGLTIGFSAKFYELGSSPDCVQGNRKVLFSLHEVFFRLEKDLEVSGIKISIPEVKVDDDGEVPKLIPIVTTDTEVGASEPEVVSETTEVSLEGVDAPACKPSKKNQRAKKRLDGSNKKAKKKKKNGLSDVIQVNCLPVPVDKNEDVSDENGNSSNEPSSVGNQITFSESVISNLQMQFEKVAAEVGLDKDGTSSPASHKLTNNGTVSKKRKRVRTLVGKDSCNSDPSGQGAAAAAKSGEKSAKKVRFSMKNNLEWKPHSPLPPHSLRLPPSVTPRGSALKKGLPPGPVREMPPATKKVKQKKKGRKGIKTVSPAIKRLRKIRTISI
uniref:Ribosomal RNA processing protein 1 homolog n=1 Tax=Davidia involucrata TaxID=16924 RepID=A0A5B7BGV9_DAVIN